MFDAKNLLVNIKDAKVPVAAFGKGEKNLIVLPGVGDGLTTVEGKALLLRLSYPKLAKKFRVYFVSRRLDLPENFGIKDMAEDLLKTMDALGIEKASVFGVSMGGMIAQHFAAAYPERTEKLVLAVTTPKCSSEMDILKDNWFELAKKGDGVGLMRSSMENMYTADYYRKNGWLCEITGRFSMPKSYERFIRMGFACAEHDASAVLKDIKAQTLVVGGEADRTVGAEGSRILAKEIENARLILFPGMGHAVYDEEPEFYKAVFEFLVGET